MFSVKLDGIVSQCKLKAGPCEGTQLRSLALRLLVPGAMPVHFQPVSAALVCPLWEGILSVEECWHFSVPESGSMLNYF